MEQNKICPLLTTNTVVDENNTVKIGTQPVFLCNRAVLVVVGGQTEMCDCSYGS